MATTQFKYFTINFHLIQEHTPGNREVITFKNCTPERAAELRREAFTIGIRVQETVRSWFVINPRDIAYINIIGEETKIGE